MALKDALRKWTDDEKAKEAPERHKLGTRLVRDADDEESAAFINQWLDDVESKTKGGK